MKVTPEDIKVISRLVDDLCGVIIDETKGYLIETRLSAIAEELGCKTFSELYFKARYDNQAAIQNKIIDAITTQETLFFRDTSPFEALQNKALPDVIDGKTKTAFPKRLRFWSAACSTGQEPYSLAMMLSEMLPDVKTWDIQILATDISDNAVRQASQGRYADHEIKRGMQGNMLQKYFAREAGGWKVKDELRSMIQFKKMNLLKPFAGVGTFDVILCRNVAIYFSPDARRNLFLRLSQSLYPNGYLFVGASESLADLGPRFAPQHHCRAVFYQPNRRATAPMVAPALAGAKA